MLARTLVNGADLVTALSERRESLAALVGNANEATGALARQKERAGGVDRAAAAGDAAREHLVREPARHARRPRPAGRRRQAGGAQPLPPPGRRPRRGRRRAPDPARPALGHPPPRQGQRRGGGGARRAGAGRHRGGAQAALDLARRAAGVAWARPTARSRRPPTRSARRHAGDRLRAPLLHGLRRLAGRLLLDRRLLRRARRPDAHAREHRREHLRHPAEDRAVQALPGRRPRSCCRTARTC